MKEKKTAKRIGLELTASLFSVFLITNVAGYLDGGARLREYNSVERAIQSYREEGVVTGVPWDQIHDAFFGIGRGLAYRQFEK